MHIETPGWSLRCAATRPLAPDAGIATRFVQEGMIQYTTRPTGIGAGIKIDVEC